MSRRKDISPHRGSLGSETGQSEPGTGKRNRTATNNNQNNRRGNSEDISDFNLSSPDRRQNMTPQESVRMRMRAPTEPDVLYSEESSKLINRTGRSTLTEAGDAEPSSASRFAEQVPRLVYGANRAETRNDITNSPTRAEILTNTSNLIPVSASSRASVDFRVKRNHTTPHGTKSPAAMTTGTQINNDCNPRNTEVESSATSTNLNTYNIVNISSVVAFDSTEQEGDSRTNNTGEQQEKVETKPSGSNSADDDSELREFFLCKICCSGRIRRCLLIPCSHLLCIRCQQKLTTCPFCRTPVKNHIKILYSFE